MGADVESGQANRHGSGSMIAGGEDPTLARQVRELLARLNALPPETVAPALRPRGGQGARVLDLPVSRPRPRTRWPRWMVFCAEVAVILAALAIGIIGPPTVTCRQMRDQGLFFYGTTVTSCVRGQIASRYEALDASIARAARGL